MEIQRHSASVEQIDALLREPPEIADEPGAAPLLSAPATVVADRLSFTRGDVPVLQDVSFEVRAGETLGVVGPSGAGKTTLLNLLARFYDPTSGAVRFDGADLRRLRVRDVYGALAIVTQDPFLFSMSIPRQHPLRTSGGLRPRGRGGGEGGRDPRRHHGDAGLRTLVGHGGRKLSRGEAQRVNIARAVLKNAPVLLLDEATSSLDSHAEARVQRALDRLASGRLTVSVAHRLSTLRGASRILVLEGGRAAGLGPHAELMERCETYRRLWEAQAAAPAGPETGPGGPPRPRPDPSAEHPAAPDSGDETKRTDAGDGAPPSAPPGQANPDARDPVPGPSSAAKARGAVPDGADA
jgi:ABC-type multidrug transport system fused ATPase/permease subunit